MWASGTATFADGLRKASGGRPLARPVEELPDEALTDLRPTAEIEDELFQVQSRLKRADTAAPPEAPQAEAPNEDQAAAVRTGDGLDVKARNVLLDRQRRLTRQLAEARERDCRSAQRGRPSGCWCLGAGGRGEKSMFLGVAIDPAARMWEARIEAPLDVIVFESYCPCPDGARAAAEQVEALRQAVVQLGQQRQDRELRQHWADVGLPDNSEHYPTLDDYPTADPRQARALANVRRWRPPRWLYLYGPTRRGKTTLAAALARHADRDLHWTVRFRTVSAILDRLKAAMDHEDETVDDVLKPLLDVELLVLDELGTEPSTRWALERLFLLLDTRLVKQRTTIITSNHDLGREQDSLAFHLAAGGKEADFRIQAGRIVARIKEEADVVLVDGPALAPARRDALPW